MSSKPNEADWLKARGFDGLYHPDPAMECGCFLGDLRPCGQTGLGCRGGVAASDGSGVYRPNRNRAVRASLNATKTP
jgi:hypothetical protein